MLRELITKETLLARYAEAKKLSGVRGEILLQNVELVPGTNLSGLNLEGIKMRNCCLVGVNLCLTNLADADLSGADLTMANLNGADLHKANLRDANLRNATMKGTDVSDAVLSYANMYMVKMDKDTTLDGAELFSADMRRAILDGTDVSKVRMDSVKTEGMRSAELHYLNALPEVKQQPSLKAVVMQERISKVRV